MTKLSIRGKLAVLFCIAIFTSLITIGLSAYSSYELTELEAQKAQEIMLDGQKEKLKSAVSSMAAALSGAVANLGDEQEQLKLMRTMIKDAFYEDDSSGYYFIYKDTVNVAHPVKPSLHGKDLDNLVGKDGIYSVRELARAARNGGDFVHFTWDKPGYDKPMPKLGYAAMIPGTDFWIGTGVYIDNIKRQAALIRTEMEEQNFTAILIQSGISAGLLLLILLPAGIIMGKGIIKPIIEIKEEARKIASGNFDTNLTVTSKDEIGELQVALSEMADSLQENITEITRKEQEAAYKAEEALRASAEAKAANDLAETKAAELLEAAIQLDNVVDSVSAASENLMVQIEQSSAGATEQASRVEETASAMEEMNATVMEVARNAASAAEDVDKARNMAEEGAKVVFRAVGGIETVSTQSKVLMEDMTTLGNQAEGIGEVINVINDIADQTNLLALNAAIEAARAGEAGRGFAVVADEVRKLAEKTMAATNDVSNAVKSIQDEARKNIDNTVKSVETITEVTELATASGESLREIVTLVNAATAQVQSIATAADQQSAASDEINRSITGISEISIETSDAMTLSRNVVSDLSVQIKTLNSMTERMKG
ncbi:methyl-accepting chemotaxis protein [Maridesulfovibrio salexigens]|uniref:Methyl-accepting chemotaxis sensory transducer with Cache sensor n=1 Tax=Maridesulfovibrio salexigens (strain ATCC 14822 / DSM 2638 / NCIMB 8403 / VKM B-1763) TaxID=526222 RepID=C6BS42_MARSD|nr:methyl-accepting chemotaxis protein [Maridesulfovibrio salexigens]ACS81425.1 methyl-accepting chemotaxis sensory transducer with Cache sensor [Maridesulfovibrio salexigens DSM 2638]